MPDSSGEAREALRRKLRAMKSERGGGGGGGGGLPTSASLSNDPATALLSLGVDDPSILASAPQIVALARAAARGVGSLPVQVDESDEEGPPPSSPR